MSGDLVIGIMQNALMTALMVAAPLLGAGLIVGLMVSIFQSVTQIQEMTLTFIPKILAVVFASSIFGPWMMQKMLSFTTNLFMNIPVYVGK